MIKGLTLRHVYLANAALVGILLSVGLGFFLGREFPAAPVANSGTATATAPGRNPASAGKFPGLGPQLPAECPGEQTVPAHHARI